jgi:hypothetical protein
MNEALSFETARAQLAVRRLLNAVDRAIAAAREIEAARAALDSEVRRTPSLRTVSNENEDTDAG